MTEQAVQEPEQEQVDERYLRQSSFVPRERIITAHAMVIGLGAIGRPLALQLASIGCPVMTLIDFDRVEDVNIATQGFNPKQIGMTKVEAVAADINRQREGFDPIELNVHHVGINGRLMYEAAQEAQNLVVFACVDKISVRRTIFNLWRNLASPLLCDARMLGEVMRILTATRQEEYIKTYGASLFAQADAEAGRCTARTTIYTSNIAAGMLVHQFTRWLRGMDTDKDLTISLMTSEIFETPVEEQPEGVVSQISGSFGDYQAEYSYDDEEDDAYDDYDDEENDDYDDEEEDVYD